MRQLSAIIALAALSACGFYPFGDDGYAPSASEEQLHQFIVECGLEGAKVEKGTLDGETEWVVAMGKQPQAKWDCLKEKKRQAGVIATSWGTNSDQM